MTDPTSFPPELGLADDDIVESFETVEAEIIEFVPEALRVSGFDGVGTRRESRERALALLYEAEQKGLSPLASIVDELPVRPEAYAAELIVGVSDHLASLDATLSGYSRNWPIERMPAIDRALLRIGLYELTYTDVPVGAAISEAVELAKRYSTDDSHRFVNGLLARAATEVRPAS